MTDKDKNVLVGSPTSGDAYISKTVVEVVSLRDQFAMAAMTGLMAISPAKDSLKGIAEFSYIAADAMMEARK